MRTLSLALALVLLCGCSDPADLTCGAGTAPQIVTGLNGVIDDTTPAVEIQLRVPETCEVLDTSWTFWNESTDMATVGEEPTSGSLDRGGVDVGDESIYFRAQNVGV